MNRDEKSRNSREKIIQAAFSLFATKGYDATTTQDIINLSELSRGAMYHHFKSKEDILNCVTRDFQEQSNAFWKELAEDTSLSIKEKFTKVFNNNNGNNTQRKLAYCCWLEKIPFALLDEVRNLNNIIAPCLAKMIQQGVDNGEFECEHPHELAEILVLSTDVWLNPVLFHRSYEEICSRLDFLLDLLDKLQIHIINKDDIQNLKLQYIHSEFHN